MKVKRRTRSFGVVILALLMVLCATICLMPRGTIAKAGALDGNFKDFSVRNMNYYQDQNTDKVLNTDKYKYGTLSLWTGVYNIYDAPSDTFYVLVCAEAKINASGNSASKRYFRNKEIFVKINYSAGNEVRLVYSAPINDNKSGGTVSYNLGISSDSASVSFSDTRTYSDIDFFADENVDEIGSKELTFKYNFKKYNNGPMQAPWIGPIHENIAGIFSIPNYSTYRQYNDVLTISYDGTIFKDAKWPLENYTWIDNITHTYRF